MTDVLSKDDFRKAFLGQDLDVAYHSLHGIPLEKIEDYCSLDEMETFGKRMAHAVSGGGFEFYRAEFALKDANLDGPEKLYEDALIKGFRDGFFELLDKDIQHANFFLGSITYGNGWDDSNLFIEKLFSNEDIEKISQAYIDMEDAGKSDPNFFTYGHFLLFLARQPMYGDPFKNRRAAVPIEHVEKYIPMARWDQKERVIRFAAASPEHAHLINEEFFAKTLGDSMARVQPGASSSFWKDMLRSEQTKTWFEEHAPKIFHEMTESSVASGKYFDIARLARFLAHAKLLYVVDVEDMTELAAACAKVAGQEKYYSEIATAALKNEKFKSAFNAEQIAAVTDRLTTFPPKENFQNGSRSAHNNYDYDFGQKVDDQLSAFGELVISAVEQGLADKILSDTFNRATIVYECGNNMNAVSDVSRASKLRPDFRAAYVQGCLAVKDPRKTYTVPTGYDAATDKFTYAPEAK